MSHIWIYEKDFDKIWYSMFSIQNAEETGFFLYRNIKFLLYVTSSTLKFSQNKVTQKVVHKNRQVIHKFI